MRSVRFVSRNDGYTKLARQLITVIPARRSQKARNCGNFVFHHARALRGCDQKHRFPVCRYRRSRNDCFRRQKRDRLPVRQHRHAVRREIPRRTPEHRAARPRLPRIKAVARPQAALRNRTAPHNVRAAYSVPHILRYRLDAAFPIIIKRVRNRLRIMRRPFQRPDDRLHIRRRNFNARNFLEPVRTLRSPILRRGRRQRGRLVPRTVKTRGNQITQNQHPHNQRRSNRCCQRRGRQQIFLHPFGTNGAGACPVRPK